MSWWSVTPHEILSCVSVFCCRYTWGWCDCSYDLTLIDSRCEEWRSWGSLKEVVLCSISFTLHFVDTLPYPPILSYYIHYWLRKMEETHKEQRKKCSETPICARKHSTRGNTRSTHILRLKWDVPESYTIIYVYTSPVRMIAATLLTPSYDY